MERRIYTYWHQGFESAPELVRRCFSQLQAINKSWDIYAFDAETIVEYLDPFPIPEKTWAALSLAHRSDLIRTQLLVKYGGVWSDPTIWFCKSIDDWLPALMDVGVFMFHRPGRDRAISNWFIAAEPSHPIMVRQYEALCRYWRENEFSNLNQPMSQPVRLFARLINRNLELPRLWVRKSTIWLFRTYPYMIYHYMLYDLVRSDDELNRIWEAMPKVSANGPHYPSHKGLLSPLDEETRRLIDSHEVPLFKLTWKLPSLDIPHDSILAYLFKTDKPQVALGADF